MPDLETPQGPPQWRRLARLVAVALPFALVVAAVLVLPGYVPLVPRVIRRQVTEGFLRSVLVGYAAALLLAGPGVALGTIRVVKARRRRERRPFAARLLVLCIACLVGLMMLELGATAWGAWAHRMPVLPTRFSEPSAPDTTHIVVIGGSSALGEPYRPWLSVGQIIGWQLGRAVPSRRFDVTILARLGASLEHMHKALADLKRRPDVVIIYSGHNEFVARFEEERDLWLDEEPRAPLLHPFYRASLHSAFCRMVYETISHNRLDGPPPALNRHAIVDPPVCSPSEAAEVLANFRRRLEAITGWCDRIGALPILIIPPANDGGFEPSRSVLPATASESERATVTHAFQDARSAESDPARAEVLYRSLIARQRGFAEAHFRLARLLENRGEWSEANREYVRARDLDGLPIRCPSVFQDEYRAVAARHDCVLIDGPAVLRPLSPHEILDDHAIQDAHHPNLTGYVTLADAVLAGLRRRKAFGMSETSAPSLDPTECADHFGMDAEKWATVCERTSVHYLRTANYRHDPTERRLKGDRYAAAARQIRAGTPPEAVGILGVGVVPSP